MNADGIYVLHLHNESAINESNSCSPTSYDIASNVAYCVEHIAWSTIVTIPPFNNSFPSTSFTQTTVPSAAVTILGTLLRQSLAVRVGLIPNVSFRLSLETPFLLAEKGAIANVQLET